MNGHYDVVIVGGGITGASTAYHLASAGAQKVALIEKGTIANGGTGKSAAIIRQHYTHTVAARLTRDGLDLLGALNDYAASVNPGGEPIFTRSGWRMLLPHDLIGAGRDNVAMQRSLGIETDLIEPCPDLEWLNPTDVAGVCHEPLGGYADPVRATEAYVAQFEALGGQVMTRTPVRALVGDSRSVTGVLTDDGVIEAGAVVNAAGPYSKFLAQSVGLDLPLKAIREQDTVFEARAGRPLPDTSISNAVDAIYLRPLGERRFVIGRGFPKDYEEVDPYNFKQTADESFVMDVLARAQRRFPTLDGARRIDAYTALYDVTPDWMPFVGAREGVSGYFDASGGSGHGFKLGPALGRELAQWVLSGQVREDFRALSHDRIATGNLFQGAYGGNRA